MRNEISKFSYKVFLQGTTNKKRKEREKKQQQKQEFASLLLQLIRTAIGNGTKLELRIGLPYQVNWKWSRQHRGNAKASAQFANAWNAEVRWVSASVLASQSVCLSVCPSVSLSVRLEQEAPLSSSRARSLSLGSIQTHRVCLCFNAQLLFWFSSYYCYYYSC